MRQQGLEGERGGMRGGLRNNIYVSWGGVGEYRNGLPRTRLPLLSGVPHRTFAVGAGTTASPTIRAVWLLEYRYILPLVAGRRAQPPPPFLVWQIARFSCGVFLCPLLSPMPGCTPLVWPYHVDPRPDSFIYLFTPGRRRRCHHLTVGEESPPEWMYTSEMSPPLPSDDASDDAFLCSCGMYFFLCFQRRFFVSRQMAAVTPSGDASIGGRDDVGTSSIVTSSRHITILPVPRHIITISIGDRLYTAFFRFTDYLPYGSGFTGTLRYLSVIDTSPYLPDNSAFTIFSFFFSCKTRKSPAH